MLYHYIEDISFNGTDSKSSDYYSKYFNMNMTADLAITGRPTYYFSSASCVTTLYKPIQYATL